MRKFSLKKNQNEHEELDHLSDWVEEQEKTKETLKSGLLSFLKYIENKDEEVHRD